MFLDKRERPVGDRLKEPAAQVANQGPQISEDSIGDFGVVNHFLMGREDRSCRGIGSPSGESR